MANWTITDHYVYGDRKKLDYLHKVLRKMLSKGEDDWCTNILNFYNIDISVAGKTYRRSFVYDVSEQECDGAFVFNTEDAWGYVDFWNLFFKLLNKEGGKVFHCWQVVEEGCEVAQQHNEGDIIKYDDEYVCYYCSGNDSATEYVSDLSNVIETFNTAFDESVDLSMSFGEFDNYLDKYEFEDDDRYFNFWKFETV